MENHEINNNIINLQCLIHQEALHATVSTYKKRHKHSGKGCKLYFFPRVEPSLISPTTFTNSGLYGDLLYFCNVRWLGRGEMLPRVYTLREKIAIFLEKTQMLPNFAIKNGNLI